MQYVTIAVSVGAVLEWAIGDWVFAATAAVWFICFIACLVFEGAKAVAMNDLRLLDPFLMDDAREDAIQSGRHWNWS